VIVPAGDAVAPPEDWPARLPLIIENSPPGRAKQMNRGARRARGDWLWFLHADSHLSSNCLPQLLRFVAREQDALGWFDLAFLPDGPGLMWLNALGANLRSRWLGLPFGDQGFVLPAHTFATLGGYDETIPDGEDHRLVWRARQAGVPLERIGATLTTSARKYREHGWWRVTRRHLQRTLAQAYDARTQGQKRERT
jgi:GT2 family glycosyltransferase